jgi:23S rRNA (adenine2503-C2)-methyltransferase
MNSEVKKDIRALSQQDLREFFGKRGLPEFRGNQVFEWLWKRGVHSFEEMTNLSLNLRNELASEFSINHIEVDRMQRSADGTIKNAVKLFDGLLVESVLIPTESRTTACVSSQVGCSLDCAFCATARLKRMRNLNPDEIYDQVLIIDRQSRMYHGRPLSNIVFMGMGEPLMNYPNVMKAIDKITSSDGLGLSPKRITVSTSGIPKMIRKMADEYPKFKLAVSLHSAIDATRTSIMPFNATFPLSELREAIQYWYSKTQSRVTYEYVVWKGINDKDEDIRALVSFCKAAPSKVNLIQYNPIGDEGFVQAGANAVKAYLDGLQRAGITVTVRKSRGQDIDAACGQLANKSESEIA